jgi:hypothetical protein
VLPLVRVYDLVASSHRICHDPLDLREDVLSKVYVQVRHRLVEIQLIIFKRDLVAKLVLSVIIRSFLDRVIGEMNEFIKRLKVVFSSTSPEVATIVIKSCKVAVGATD